MKVDLFAIFLCRLINKNVAASFSGIVDCCASDLVMESRGKFSFLFIVVCVVVQHRHGCVYGAVFFLLLIGAQQTAMAPAVG